MGDLQMLSIIVVLQLTLVLVGHGVLILKDLVLDMNTVISDGASLQVRAQNVKSAVMDM